jgi:hypothetical protein
MLFGAAHDDLEEILGCGVRQCPHGEIADQQERDGGALRQVLLPRARQLGIREFIEQHMGFAVEHAMACWIAARPIACARWLLPVPGGPWNRPSSCWFERLAGVAEASLLDAAIEEPILAAEQFVLASVERKSMRASLSV